MASTPRNCSAINSNDRFLRWPEVKDRIGYSRSQVHSLVKKGCFPAPIKLGVRASAWLQSSIDAWISDRVVASEMRAAGQERAEP